MSNVMNVVDSETVSVRRGQTHGTSVSVCLTRRYVIVADSDASVQGFERSHVLRSGYSGDNFLTPPPAKRIPQHRTQVGSRSVL